MSKSKKSTKSSIWGCPIENAIRKKATTPLIKAYLENDKERVRILLLSGNHKKTHYLILRQACKNNDKEMVAFLLENELANPHDNTALLHACEHGYEGIVDVFFFYNNHMSQYNPDALEFAKSNGHNEIVRKWDDNLCKQYPLSYDAKLTKGLFEQIIADGNELELLGYKKRIVELIHTEEAQHGLIYLIKKGYQFEDSTAHLSRLALRGLIEPLICYLEKNFRNIPAYSRKIIIKALSANTELINKERHWITRFSSTKTPHKVMFREMIKLHLEEQNISPLELLTMFKFTEWQKAEILVLIAR